MAQQAASRSHSRSTPDLDGEDSTSSDIFDRSGQFLSWARRCAERAERFRMEGREPLAMAQMERCSQYLQLALMVYRGNLSARFFLVGCLMVLGQFVTAKEQALEALRQIDEDRKAKLQDPVLHLAIAHISARLGQAEDAIAYINQATNEFPAHPQPCAALGRALSRAGRHFAGMKMARLALERDGDPRCPARLTEGGRQAALRCLGECLAEQAEHEPKAEIYLQPPSSGMCESWCAPACTLDDACSAAASSEVAIAARYGRPGASVVQHAADSDPATPSVCSRLRHDPSGRLSCSVYPCTLAQAPLRHVPLLQIQADNIGRHVVVPDRLTVMSDASASSVVIKHLSAGTVVNVSDIVFNEEEQWFYGCIDEPAGWISVLNAKTGYRWAKKEALAAAAPFGSPRARSLPFGPPDNPGVGPGAAGMQLPAGALGDLERVLSGLFPAAGPGLRHSEESPGSGVAEMFHAASCSRCYTCCTCSQGCVDT